MDPSGQTSKLYPNGNIGIIVGNSGGYRILAGFPPQSNQPKWDQTFDLESAHDFYVFKTDYCLWAVDTLIGCATNCYHPSPGDSFPNPYLQDQSNPESQNPVHGNPPALLTFKQKFQYRETCSIETQKSSDSGSVFPQVSSLSAPNLIGESATNNDPDASFIGISQGTAQTGSPYILTPEPVENPLDLFRTPETSVDLDSPLVSPLEPMNWERIFSRNIRKSPRDFRRDGPEH
ncbi:hypothetical protein MMC29_005203 [Sticta canariensis]|nr:hypothetical protein [Sticta canariensis]